MRRHHSIEVQVVDPDPVLGQHRHIVVSVVGRLAHRRVFKQGLEVVQGFLQGYLAALQVPHWYVAGLTRNRRERHAHQIRGDWVFPRSLHVEGEAAGSPHLRYDGLQVLHVVDCRVLALLRDNLLLHEHSLGRLLLLGYALRHPGHYAPELQVTEKANHLLAVVLPEAAGLGVQGDGHAGHYRRKLQTLPHPGLVGCEGLPYSGRDHAVYIRIDALYAAIVLYQLDGGLPSDFRHSGNVVRRVTLQRLDVRLLSRTQASVVFSHRGLVVDISALYATAQDHPHRGRHQLEGVGVSRQYDGLHSLLRGLAAEGPQNVVGLVLLHLENGHVEGLHQPPHPGKLGPEPIGRLRPLGLVVGELDVPERGCRHIEGDCAVSRLPILDGLDEGVRECVDATHVLVRLAQGQGFPNAVPRPVHHSMAVHEHEQRRLSH